MVGTIKKMLPIKLVASGIKEKKEIDNITPAEKAKEKGIIISCFLPLKKIGKIPNIVAKPAKLVIIKLIIIEFILKYMKKKKNNAKTKFFIFLIISFQSLE